MSTLTITNSLYVPPFSITETLRNENPDTCSDSFVEFNVTGEVTNEPLKLRYDGSPSGATVEITKIGTGLGIIKDASTGTEFFSDVQPGDGQFNLFSEVDLLLTNTGTTKFRFRISSSVNYRNPTTQNMVLLSCTNVEGSTEVSTFASGSIDTVDNTTTFISVSNNKTMYYTDI